jgi:hypothetical protein
LPGDRDFVVPELIVRGQVIRFCRERWLAADGRTVLASLPAGVQGHYAPSSRATCWPSITRGR